MLTRIVICWTWFIRARIVIIANAVTVAVPNLRTPVFPWILAWHTRLPRARIFVIQNPVSIFIPVSGIRRQAATTELRRSHSANNRKDELLIHYIVPLDCTGAMEHKGIEFGLYRKAIPQHNTALYRVFRNS